jgi:hypothetical protein
MIHSLRQRHRRMIIVVGVFLPLAFALGIAARKPVPSMNALPGQLVAAPPTFTATEWERADLFMKAPIPVRLLREHTNVGRFAVTFSAAKDFVKPDLLVYWVAGNPNFADTLPANAQLLGAFDSFTALALPAEAALQSGVLVLYSLADNEIVEVSKPLAISKP